jgi:TonB family protein
MVRRSLASLILAVCLSAGAQTTPAGLSADFKNQLLKQVLIFRQPFKGNDLHYLADGTISDRVEPGPWTVYGTLQVKGVDTTDKGAKIWGARIMASYDDSKRSLSYFATDEKVVVWIDFGHAPGQSEVEEALKHVFLAPGESRADFVPDYWRKCLGGTPTSKPPTAGQIVRISSGVSSGNLIFKKQPIYPMSAKAYRVTGRVSLQVRIDKSGNITSIDIAIPAGAGLDESAIDAVKEWKYKPYTLNGEPMDVETVVVVNFTMG